MEGQKTSRGGDNGWPLTSCDSAHFYFLAIHDEDARNGTANIFRFIEPLLGRRFVSVNGCKTALDWAEEGKCLAKELDHFEWQG